MNKNGNGKGNGRFLDIRDSIKWRVFTYYTLLMVIIVGVLLAGFYYYETETRLRLLNLDLQSRAVGMVPHIFNPRSIRPPIPGRGPPGPRGRRGRQAPSDSGQVAEELSPYDSSSSAERSTPGPGFAPNRNTNRPGPPPRSQSPTQQGPRRDPANTFLTEEQRENGYFVVAIDGQGEVFYRSENAPDDFQVPETPTGPSYETIVRKDVIIMIHVVPTGAVFMGLPRRAFEQETRWIMKKATLAGVVVVLVTALLGFVMLQRSLNPVAQIGETAARIAAGNLEDRINVAEQRSELGQLANVLNTTFSRLEAALKRQVRFTADASHELRTPVAAILAECQFSLKKERPPERYRETIEICHESAQHMGSLIADLGMLAKFDANSKLLEFAPHELREVLQSALEISQPLAAEHQVTLHSDLQKMPVKVDRRRLTQAVLNLLSNAIRYNKTQGSVTLSSRREGEHAVITVRDTGIGIPEDQVDKVFDRFYRVDSSRSQDLGGSGLGLSITRNIITGHGGDIWVTSKLGEGTCMTFTIPVAAVEEENPDLVQTSEQESDASGRTGGGTR